MWNKISIWFRLNPQIFSLFESYLTHWWKLADSTDSDQDILTDEALVSWSFGWKLFWWDFQILPIERVKYYTNSALVENTDQLIRETVINQMRPAGANFDYNFIFEDDRNPIYNNFDSEPLNVISSSDLWTDTYTNIFQDANYTDLYFTFNLVNFLNTNIDTIYPFLEYKIDFDNQIVPDEFYTIIWQSKVWKFKVQIKTQLPSNDQQSAFSDFTVIF